MKEASLKVHDDLIFLIQEESEEIGQPFIQNPQDAASLNFHPQVVKHNGNSHGAIGAVTHADGYIINQKLHNPIELYKLIFLRV